MVRALGALLCAVVAAEAEVPARGTRQRLRGATREIGDVATELEHVESLEHRVEQDLTRVFADFANGTAAPGGGLAGWFGRRPEEASPGFTAALGAHLSEMRRDLASLVRTINATRAELSEARDAVGTTEKALASARQAERHARLAERLRDGKVAVNDGAAQESEIPNFKGSDLGHFPLVSADFWTSDHLSERSRSVDAFSETRARGTLTLKRR